MHRVVDHPGAVAARTSPGRFMLPKRLWHRARAVPVARAAAHASPAMVAAATAPVDAVLAGLAAGRVGLSTAAADARRAVHGPNIVAAQPRPARLQILGRSVGNPLVALLAVLAMAALATGDLAAAALVAFLLAIGVGLRFAQESRADDAAAALTALVSLHATVLRDGRAVELPVDRLVPGDLVHLAAGDMVPADVRIVSCKDLFVSQAGLTGESIPVEKFARPDAPAVVAAAPLEMQSVCWLGTSVASGSAEAVVVVTGRETFLGGVSATVAAAPPPTAFDRGLRRFTWLMVGLVLVMVPVVFVVNGVLKGDWPAAFLFALAVGVGLAPEMLPMIVAVCLSRGAIAMAGKRVIVKHLEAIENLGAMDVLCTDKTGTLTLDRIILERHCDVRLREDPEVLRLAWLNSHFQTSLKNLLDRAILEHEAFRERVPHEGYAKVDEIPFDFDRRLMSVVVAPPQGGRQLICKGAPEAVHVRCASVAMDGATEPLTAAARTAIGQEFDRLSGQGFRVLAVATRDLPDRPAYTRDDERDLVLRGYVAFLDPPKDSAAAALQALARGGVSVKVLTGDNELVSRTVCRQVGIAAAPVLLGSEVDHLDDAQLGAAAERATLLARLTPGHKARIVTALQARGHVVGFLGDGSNDSPALRAADVGLSVESAADIARESADCILLEKDLRVLEEGVREGRRVFVNILKYIRMGASSNFGNMLSVLLASVALPFVPMTPLQILANNLLYDCSQVPIPTDDVDPEQIARPRPWSLRQVARFVLLMGPCSSFFDALTFAVLWYGFGCSDPARMPLFRTAWFVESLLTQTLVIHVIRTDRMPFLSSRSSRPLAATTAAVAVVAVWLPSSPLAKLFGFVPLPAAWWPVLGATLAGYLAAAWGLKKWLVARGWVD
jgi:Mg2+-importing ATPase